MYDLLSPTQSTDALAAPDRDSVACTENMMYDLLSPTQSTDALAAPDRDSVACTENMMYDLLLSPQMLSIHSIHRLSQLTRVFTRQTGSVGAASQKVFSREDKYGAHNYAPIPVALTRAEG